MKDKNVRLLVILFIIIFTDISFHFGLFNYNFHTKNTIDFIDLKNAGYWDLTGSNILIDDLDPTKNWSYTASQYDWCSGSGTWNDPYIIENVTI
ncbi:unnamed protein product, partial [marine sediment metagenome]